MSLYAGPSLNCSWSAITNHIKLVEDPIYQSPVDLQVYQDIYGPLLDTLDGLDEESKVRFFFETSPVNRSILLFRN